MNKSDLYGLEKTIEEAMGRLNVPGAAISVVKDGKTVFSETFGYADKRGKIALSPEHLLPMGSSSKAITATAVIMLAAEGALDLDEPIRTYMPAFALCDPIASREATPRDLLCHRTGLPRHDMMWINWQDLTRKDLVQNRLKHLSPNRPFRSGWQYQNQMFAVLGYLVEAVSGLPWETFVERRIFKPLGISEYSFRIPEQDPAGRYAKLYTPNADGKNRENTPLILDAMGPAGSVNLPITELTKWLTFNLCGGKVGRKQLIDAAVFAELFKPNIPYQILPFSFPERIAVGYGLGWTIDAYRGHRMIDHGGNVHGGSALLSFLPDEGLGCAILTNADSNMFPSAFALTLYDRYLGIEDDKDWFSLYDDHIKALLAAMRAELSSIRDKRIPDKAPAHGLRDYAGTYHHGAYGDIVVTTAGGALRARYHDNRLKVVHLHYETFTFELYGDVFPITFRTAADGSVAGLEIPFERTAEAIYFVRER